MASVFLIRHGEVAGNHGSGDRVFYSGWDDVPLTARGTHQAEAVARRMAGEKLHAVYSSDLQRARLTAQAIAAPHGIEVRCDAVWRETNFGAWNGKSESEILEGWPDLWRARQSDPMSVAPPEGESLLDLANRLAPAWQQIVTRHEHEQIALIAHQGVIRVLLLLILEAPLAGYRRLKIGNCSVSRVEVVAGETSVSFLNETHHLLGLE
ncbi:MAG: hypothetical protein JWN98_564 [Abditibacteriota bacterium]|nr:hypothetical protein [Abditibacteriota bacterium]